MSNLIDVMPKMADFDYFPTGSRVYGCANADSDWDWCFNVYNQDEIEKWLNNQRFNFKRSTNYENAIRIKFSPKLDVFKGSGIFNICDFNFIFLDDNNYFAWQKATEIVTQLVKSDSGTRNKNSRMAVFTSVVLYFNGHY